MKQNIPTEKPTLPQGWTPRKIRYQLLVKGLLPKHIAQRLGLSQQLITATIRGAREGLKPRQALADVLGVPVTDIWPDALLPLRERRRLRSAS